jgi:hypothetical protein
MKEGHENKTFKHNGESHLFIAVTGECDVYVASIAGVRVAVLTGPFTVQIGGHCVGVGQDLEDAFKMAIELAKETKRHEDGRDQLGVG